MQVTQSRKQRERESRERHFLELALNILTQEGYLGLTMDKLAQATGFAKGTLYLHFKNKEDLICALLGQFQQRRVELFQRVAGFQGPHRARLAALGFAAELFVLNYPENARIEPILKAVSIRNKASKERREFLDRMEQQCFDLVLSTARDAIAAGELILRPGETPEQLVFGLWSIHMGANVLTHIGPETSPAHGALGEDQPFTVLPLVISRLLDGYGWSPLSTEFDYCALRRTLAEQYFAEEVDRAQALSGWKP